VIRQIKTLPEKWNFSFRWIYPFRKSHKKPMNLCSF
jgi:hypothetical protein